LTFIPSKLRGGQVYKTLPEMARMQVQSVNSPTGMMSTYGAPFDECQARHGEAAGTHIINRAIVAKNSSTQTAATIRTTLPQKAGLNRPMVFWGFIAAP